MKYVVYLRVSTDIQVQSGLGLEGQRNTCLAYMKNGDEYVEFSDEGFSGALDLDKRPGLMSALNALEADDVLLIATRDRLGRDTIINAMIERAVERKKARIVSASGDFRDDNDPSSVLMRRMMDAFAEYERLIIGARIKVALQIKKTRGERVGYIPYGYRVSEDGKKLEEETREQFILEKMKELRRRGGSFRGICEEMNQVGYLNRYGRPWNHVALQRMIKRPVAE